VELACGQNHSRPDGRSLAFGSRVVVNRFRPGGPDRQTRMDEALKKTAEL
jgi:hypothetical protein